MVQSRKLKIHTSVYKEYTFTDTSKNIAREYLGLASRSDKYEKEGLLQQSEFWYRMAYGRA